MKLAQSQATRALEKKLVRKWNGRKRTMQSFDKSIFKGMTFKTINVTNKKRNTAVEFSFQFQWKDEKKRNSQPIALMRVWKRTK